MWTALSAVEIQELKAEKFSQPETCLIANLSPERLFTWHRDNLVPEPRATKGRGKRRKYNFTQIAYLIGMRVLMKRGVGVHHAARLAEIVIAPRIEDAFASICSAATIEAAYESDPSLLVIYDCDEPEGQESYRFQVLFRDRVLNKAEQEPTLREWMRGEDTISDAIVIDPAGLALALRWSIEEVIERRGTDSFRDDLQEFFASFKRQKTTPKTAEQICREAFAEGLRPDPEGDS